MSELVLSGMSLPVLSGIRSSCYQEFDDAFRRGFYAPRRSRNSYNSRDEILRISFNAADPVDNGSLGTVPSIGKRRRCSDKAEP